MTQTGNAQPVVWDRYAIKAEIHRRGMTMTGIARAAGLRENACRKALHGFDRQGADAIADALGIPFDTLFPTGFLQSRSNGPRSTRKTGPESRKKRACGSDKTRVQA